MASMIGSNERPNAVMAYSDRGGSSGKIVLTTSPSSANSRSCKSNTRGAASGKARCRQLGRMGPWRSSSRMQDFHLELIRLMVNRRGQLRSTGIFRWYIGRTVRLYAAKIKIIHRTESIPKKFSVPESFFGTCTDRNRPLTLQQSNQHTQTPCATRSRNMRP